jgi:hypothetical protein
MSGMADVYEAGVCPICGGRNGIHVWAGTRGCPAVTGNPFEQHLKEKDAEIERLKAQVKELSEAYQKAIGPISPAHSDLKQLITELADALEEGDGDGFFITENIELIQRAREATNGR